MTVRPPQMTTAVEKHAKGCSSPLWNAAPPSWYAAATFNAVTNTFRHAGVCLMLLSSYFFR